MTLQRIGVGLAFVAIMAAIGAWERRALASYLAVCAASGRWHPRDCRQAYDGRYELSTKEPTPAPPPRGLQVVP